MNRGVDKRTIVLDDKDRRRFVADLYSLNDTRPVESLNYHLAQAFESGLPYRAERKRVQLVQIHAWCLMGNHYHLLLSPTAKDGVSRFLQKLNMGYAKYFNERYVRTGALFQGKTKRILIENDRQFLYILPYIHLNPLDFMKGSREWRRQSIVNRAGALRWVTEYRWSSCRNYYGEKEFTEILEGSELFADRKSHTQELEQFLHRAPNESFTNLNLE
jgi:putative transposase